MKKHFNISVRGKVQGVFFRASAQEKAQSLGIEGFVQNRDDGSVYIEAEGEMEILFELVKWCREGPPKASVTGISVSESALKNFTGFQQRRF